MDVSISPLVFAVSMAMCVVIAIGVADMIRIGRCSN